MWIIARDRAPRAASGAQR